MEGKDIGDFEVNNQDSGSEDSLEEVLGGLEDLFKDQNDEIHSSSNKSFYLKF